MAKTLSSMRSGMPQMNAAFGGWGIPIVLQRITQTVVDGLVVEQRRAIRVSAIWQPLDAEAIKLKPEGQRSWEWIDLHIRGQAIFTTNDRVLRNGMPYKVMAVKDYSLNNYTEYHLIRDYDYVAPSTNSRVMRGADRVMFGDLEVVARNSQPGAYYVRVGENYVMLGLDIVTYSPPANLTTFVKSGENYVFAGPNLITTG